jgi:hypothetical protein
LHQSAAEALRRTPETYTLGQLRSDLAKPRGKGLVERLAGTQAYRLPSAGYRIAVLYLKLFQRIDAPWTRDPVPWDDRLPPERRASLDCLDASVDRALNHCSSPSACGWPPEARRKLQRIKKLEKREQNSHFGANNGLESAERASV